EGLIPGRCRLGPRASLARRGGWRFTVCTPWTPWRTPWAPGGPSPTSIHRRTPRMEERDLIYDWNVSGERWTRPPFRIQFDDETLRDGLQSPSVRSPAIEDKIRILHLMDELGIDTADIGLPGAGPHVVGDVLRLAQEIRSAGLEIHANCAARTLRQDITPVIEVSQK